MIPRTITYDEIRKGDRLRCEYPNGSALEVTVVRQDEDGNWGTAQRDGDDPDAFGFAQWTIARECEGRTITLLDRPTPPLPQEQGAPIMIYAYRNPVNDRRTDVEIVAVRSGSRFRDMGGLHYEDHEILAWAPLVAGERVKR